MTEFVAAYKPLNSIYGGKPQAKLTSPCFDDIIFLIPDNLVSKVFIYEFKVYPKVSQIVAIEEAIRTTQFVRNKVLRFWMDNRGVGKTEMFRYIRC